MRAVVFVVALASTGFATNAAASHPSVTDIATARELYKDGADALDMGNAKVAVEKLAQAWSLVQTPVIGTDLARAQRRLGHLVEAREAALAVQRLPSAHDETSRSTEARTDADKIAAELVSRIPHVKLTLQGVGEGHAATVKFDGAVVPEGSLAVARQANPGAHIATLDTDDGRHAEGSATLAEGETKEISLTVPAPTTTTTTEPKPTALEPQHVDRKPDAIAPMPQSAHYSPVLWVGVTTSAVGLVVGALTGAFALNEASIVKQQCQATGTDGKLLCPPAYAGDLDSANALGIVSTIGFAALGVGAVLVVVGLAVGKSKSDSPMHARIIPLLGPVSGIAGVF
jgi:hypothetical protein